MEEIPFQSTPVQRLKAAILPLDLACSGSVTHLGDILITGKSHKKNLDGKMTPQNAEGTKEDH
jgi:hypothetical protein